MQAIHYRSEFANADDYVIRDVQINFDAHQSYTNFVELALAFGMINN